MPVIYQKFIYRVDLQANPHILYLFGDNLKRQGLGGQAKEMRGEPNAVGIATKKLPSQYENSYFCDDDFDLFEDHYLVDMEPVYKHLALDGILIIPLDGLGTCPKDRQLHQNSNQEPSRSLWITQKKTNLKVL
jgi:hypothetical protein